MPRTMASSPRTYSVGSFISPPVLRRLLQFSRVFVSIPRGGVMRTWMFAVLSLVTIIGVVSAQVDFKQYASTDGRYKVLFPGAVKSEIVEVPSGKTQLKVMVDSVELRGNTAFLVTYVDAPEEVAKSPPGP